MGRTAGGRRSVCASRRRGSRAYGTRPYLLGFDLDMDTGTLFLSFNEPVVPSSFRSAYVTIQNESSSAPAHAYTLSAGLVPATVADNDTLTIPLNLVDIDALKANLDLATSVNNTFLSIRSATVVDVFNNAAEPLPADNATQVTQYTPDATAPDINSFTLDLDTGELKLIVSEPIDPASFNFTQITITNGDSSTSHTLTGGELLVNVTEVTIVLNNLDVSVLKTDSSFATSEVDTYLVASPFTFVDGAGNLFVGIPADMARQAFLVVPDTSPPELLAFSYVAPGDRIGVVLVLQFSEVVNSSTFNATAITLQDAANTVDATQFFTLTDAAISFVDTSVLMVNITDEDYLTIQSLPPLAIDVNTTYLSISSGAVLDLFGAPLIEITSDNAQQASRFSVDVVSPEVIGFTFDLNAAQVIITFTEIVFASTYNATQFTIQDSSNATENVYTLTGGTARGDGNRLVISLSTFDLDELNRNSDLAVSRETTYLSLTAFAIQDASRNRVAPIPNTAALQSSRFVPDMTGPRLLSFAMNLDLSQKNR